MVRRLVTAAALLSGAAAAIHLWVAPEHFEEYPAFGAFFVACGLAQLGWAAAVLARPTRAVLHLGWLLNLAVAALWAWTRFAGGVPLGPEAGEREAVGLLDTACSAVELAIVALVATCLLVSERTAVGADQPVAR